MDIYEALVWAAVNANNAREVFIPAPGGYDPEHEDTPLDALTRELKSAAMRLVECGGLRRDGDLFHV